MRNTPLKAFIKSPIKHTEKEHKAEHDKESSTLSKKLKAVQKKIKYPGTTKDK